MFARSIKQKRYSSDTVGTMYKSIFSRSLRSVAGLYATRAAPYLDHRRYHQHNSCFFFSFLFHASGSGERKDVSLQPARLCCAHLSVATWPISAAWCTSCVDTWTFSSVLSDILMYYGCWRTLPGKQTTTENFRGQKKKAPAQDPR